MAYVSGTGVTWETPDGRVLFGKDFGELNKKLGLPENSREGVLFSRLGRDGWELTTHTMRTTGGPQPGIHGVWTFKRPAR